MQSQLNKLDYEVRLGTPAYRVAEGNGGIRTVPDNIGKVSWRYPQGNALGLVGSQFTPVQPGVTKAVLQRLGETNPRIAETLRVEVLGDGASIIATAQTGTRMSIRTMRGRSEEVEQQVLLRDGFTGSISYLVASRAYVLVCSNGMRMWKTQMRNRLRHTSGINDRFQLTVRALASELRLFEERVPLAQKLADTPLNDAGFKAILDEFFPLDPEKPSTRTQNQRDELARLYHTAPGADPGSLWGASQAFTYWITHRRGRDSSRIEQSMFGEGANLNEQVHTDLLRRADLAASL